MDTPSHITISQNDIFNIEKWAQQFMSVQYPRALQAMGDYLDTFKNYSRQTEESLLLQFLVEFLHNIKTILQEDNLFLASDPQNEHLYLLMSSCTHSPEQMKEFLSELADCDQICRCRGQADELYQAVEIVKKYIKRNLQNNIKRSELVALVYLHPDYLSHNFQKFTGMGIREYIKKERISRAKHLLSHTKLNISAIATECGYENAAYFSKIFRSEEHMTPKEFRQKSDSHFPPPTP